LSGGLFEESEDYKTAISFYLRAAQQGSALALFYVGRPHSLLRHAFASCSACAALIYE
jgi:hypothetical protein